MEMKASTKNDLYEAYQSIENQSYSCGPDETVNPDRIYVRLRDQHLLKDDDGDTLVQVSSLMTPLRNALLEVLEATQGAQGAVELSAVDGAGFATFSGGAKELATNDPLVVALIQLLEKN